MDKKFLYSCYAIPKQGVMQLLIWLYENKTVQHPNPYLHHCTIEFGSDTIVDDSMVGQSVELSVIGYCEDEYASAFIVGPCLSNNAHPHITVSCADGVKPFYANKMLGRPDDEIKLVWFAKPIRVSTIIHKVYA